MKNKFKVLSINVILLAAISTFITAICSTSRTNDNSLLISAYGKSKRLIMTNHETSDDVITFSESHIGMQRVVLSPHYSDNNEYDNLPVLDQSDFQSPNTIYVLKHDFVLMEDINMPIDCILDFEGGSLQGGEITGNNTSIIPADYSIFNDCIIKNFNLPYVDPRWVGAKPDFNEKYKTGTDNSDFFQRAYDNIAENHPGLDILVIGKYLIGKTVLMRMQCHLRGVHNNTRGYVKRNMHLETGGSSSLIAVGDCAAFRIIGREYEDRTWADLSVNHIKFLGLNKKTSIAIQYEASGAPTRPASIEKCEADNLLYFFYSKANENTTIGNLTIRDNNIYNCSKAIYAVSEPVQNMGLTALKIENNVIEHNGEKCIHLTRCFGPIIIDNNILEGESNPIYITSSYPTETSYVISNNYFEQPGNDDKKIHIDGVIKTNENSEHVTFQTNVSIYGNTSPYGFAIELNGVHIRRLDRIDTPIKWSTNYSVFTRCLFEDIDLSDIHVSQLSGWNFATHFPTSHISNGNSQTEAVGIDLLSFDDCKGNSHVTSKTNTAMTITGDISNNNLFICKLRPRFTEKSKSIIMGHTIDNRSSYIEVSFPREIPYYAFLIFQKDNSIRNDSSRILFKAYNEGTDIELGNFTIYKSTEGALFNYPHILLSY